MKFASDEKVKAASKKILAQYGDVFRRLAPTDIGCKFWMVVVYQDHCQPRLYKCEATKKPTLAQLKRWGANIHPPRKDLVRVTEVPAFLWHVVSAEWIRPFTQPT